MVRNKVPHSIHWFTWFLPSKCKINCHFGFVHSVFRGRISSSWCWLYIVNEIVCISRQIQLLIESPGWLMFKNSYSGSISELCQSLSDRCFILTPWAAAKSGVRRVLPERVNGYWGWFKIPMSTGKNMETWHLFDGQKPGIPCCSMLFISNWRLLMWPFP